MVEILLPIQIPGISIDSVFVSRSILLVIIIAILAIISGSLVRYLREQSVIAIKRESTNPGDSRNYSINNNSKKYQFDGAEKRLDQGDYDGTIQLVYSTLRNYLSQEFNVDTTGTHWDFYRNCESVAPEEIVDEVYRIIELYEQAVFDHRETTREEAELVLQLGKHIGSILEKNV